MRRLALLAMTCLALVACSSPARPGSTPSAAPGKNLTDQPELPELPAPREGVLHVSNTYTYTVQVLDAVTTVNMPASQPPPAGTTFVALLIRVQAEPANRRIKAPVQHLAVRYPSCKADMNQYIACAVDSSMPYYTEDQMRFGGQGVKGVDAVFGTLDANTAYYTWIWQIISEKANLTGATLCEALGNNCIPIGNIHPE